MHEILQQSHLHFAYSFQQNAVQLLFLKTYRNNKNLHPTIEAGPVIKRQLSTNLSTFKEISTQSITIKSLFGTCHQFIVN